MTGNLGTSLILGDTDTDLTTDLDQVLILFSGGNVFTASQVLTIGLHANNEHKASANEGDTESYVFDRRVTINLTLNQET